MGKWLDLAARLEAGDGGGDNRDERDESPPIGPIVPNVLHGLPADVLRGLAALPKMAAPRITRPDVWPTVVADAVRLAAEGWATQALALGWKDKELFGTCGLPGGDSTQEGLAVWLAGRRVLLLDALSCIVDVGAGTKAVFYGRSVRPGGVFIWDLGKATVQHVR